MIDLIGDVHGHADELVELLTKLGYSNNDNVYSHPERKALFVGDYIDRGPKIRETLQIVKGMVDHGSAIALLGNHEYNALTFHLKHPKGGYLREHSIKNIVQHYQTLHQFRNRNELPEGEKEYEAYLEWFKTLPLFYETETFRAVHACWDYKSIAYLKLHFPNNRLTDDFIRDSVERDTELYNAIEITLKGKELSMPDGKPFEDEDGNPRFEMRYKWWEDLSKMTYDKIKMHPINELPKIAIEVSAIKDNDYYRKDDKTVFFGHYWLKMKELAKDRPRSFRDNICCLDYSVAKGGHLVAYSFDDELKLDEQKFTWVKESKTS